MLTSSYIIWWAGLIVVGLFQRTDTVVHTACGGQLTQEAGQILSPNFPEVYPNEANCTWVITVQPGKIIDFTFLSFDLEDSSKGRFGCADYVALHNGPSRQDAIISGDLCAQSSERQYRSRGNQMLVYFYSDNSFSNKGFSASYNTIDCKPFTYGKDVCDKNCTCKQENTMYCNSVNGTCTCKPGWTSSDCSVDINECPKPYMCTDLYSSCVNTEGSYSCHCKHGMVLNSTDQCTDQKQCKVKKCSHACSVENTTETCYCPNGMQLDTKDNLTCLACVDWKFGENCKFDCTCDKSHTQSCDKVEGLCSCYLNWTSTNCDKNVTECTLEKPPCDTTHSACYDTIGWFECQCFQGYEKVANETTCQECGRTLTEANGTILSPHYYDGYEMQYSYFYSDCNWTIEVKEPNIISLQFSVETSNQNPCHVEIYDGDSISAKLIGAYDMSAVNLRDLIVRSSRNQMLIVRRCLSHYGSFKVIYWSHECPKFMWGPYCTTPCSCVTNNTEYCDSTNGNCVCKKAWKSKNCSIDADECSDDPRACPNYSDCTNLHGGFECKCKDGLANSTTGCMPDPGKGQCSQKKCSHVCAKTTVHGLASEKCYCPIGWNENKDQCVACKNWTYGPDCKNTCKCVPNNTASCDTVTGYCECLNTWTGPDCTRDIDECYLKYDKCPTPMSRCQNTPGGYDCICQEYNGYEKGGNGTCIPIDCSHTVTNASGIIASPNFPQNYFNNANCSWTITVAAGDVVSLRFLYTSLYLDYYSKCLLDYVDVYDGKDQTAKFIGHYCFTFPELLRSTGNNMFIMFISNSYNVYQGFNASYTSHPCPDFMYGNVSCDKNCSCNKDHTQFCDNTNGVCICTEGWIGRECDTDLNECLDTASNICPNNSYCINTVGSFKCQCHAGFAFNTSTRMCDYVDLCAHCCKFGCVETISNTSFECLCSTGSRLAADGVTCTDKIFENNCIPGKWGPECANTCSCITSNTEECNKISGNCSCKAGWTGNNCDHDINECKSSAAVCPAFSSCLNTQGGYVCACQPGYIQKNGSSYTCEECEHWKFGQNCSEMCQCNTSTTSSCNRTDGTCSCKTGWTGKDCSVDVNECQSTPAVCSDHSDCQNEPGTYKCMCHVGYKMNASNLICQECDHWNFGQNCSEMCQCNTITTSSCNRTDGTCSCKNGWTDKECSEDVNECQSTPAVCPDHSDCQNEPGTYKCMCHVGYKMDASNLICHECEHWKFGQNCSEMCQCNTSTASSCNRTDGTCSCKTGWTDKDCSEDVNECQSTPEVCPDHSDCQNEPGTYKCMCHVGYKMNASNLICHECEHWKFGQNCSEMCQCNTITTSSCNRTDGTCSCKNGWTDKECSEDVNECQSTPAVCPDHSDCQNEPGTYKCMCHVGYKMDASNLICHECEHWKFGQNCSEMCQCNTSTASSCNRTDGTCSCKTGWTDKDCSEDVNECQSTPEVCPDHSDCQNEPGTYKCMCHVGYKMNASNLICHECEHWKFGQNCSEMCQCNTITTSSCNRTDGTCSCKNGWTDKECSEDVNECQSTPAVCPDHSDCQNEPGTYKCMCHVGYKMDASNLICHECEHWKFGQNCSEMCQCNTITTSSCNRTDGTCSCKNGWTDKECSEDVDECQSTPAVCPDLSDCQNEPGTYKCMCHVGYKMDASNLICHECGPWKFGQECLSDCKCNQDKTSSCKNTNGLCECKSGWKGKDCSQVIEWAHVAMTVTLEYDVTSVDLKNESSSSYRSLRVELENEMTNELSLHMNVDVIVNIVGMRAGSLIIESQVSVPKNQEIDPEKDVTKAALKMMNQGFHLDSRTVSVKAMGVAEKQFWANESKCQQREKYDPCKEVCDEQDGEAVCEPVKDKNNFTLGMSLGISLFVVLCISIGVGTYCWARKQPKTTKNGHKAKVTEQDKNPEFELQMAAKRFSMDKGGVYNPFSASRKQQDIDRYSSARSHYDQPETSRHHSDNTTAESTHDHKRAKAASIWPIIFSPPLEDKAYNLAMSGTCKASFKLDQPETSRHHSDNTTAESTHDHKSMDEGDVYNRFSASRKQQDINRYSSARSQYDQPETSRHHSDNTTAESTHDHKRAKAASIWPIIFSPPLEDKAYNLAMSGTCKASFKLDQPETSRHHSDNTTAESTHYRKRVPDPQNIVQSVLMLKPEQQIQVFIMLRDKLIQRGIIDRADYVLT